MTADRLSNRCNEIPFQLSLSNLKSEGLTVSTDDPTKFLIFGDSIRVGNLSFQDRELPLPISIPAGEMCFNTFLACLTTWSLVSCERG